MFVKVKWLVGLLVLLLVGCETTLNGTDMEQRIEAGAFTLQVTAVYEGSDQLFDEAPAGQRRLLIDLIIENNSDSNRNFNALLMFELERPDGTKVGVELFDPQYVSADGVMAAGMSRVATLVFFVPDSEDAWTLLFSPDTFSPGSIRIDIRLT